MDKDIIKNIIKNNPIIHNGLGWASDSDKLIYVGIPKAASCSMRFALDVGNHGMKSIIAMENLPDARKNYRKFTIIREPLNRFISAVFESFKRTETPPKLMQLKTVKNPPEVINKYLTILEEDGFIEVHTAPQIGFLYSKKGELFDFDRILIFENLTADFNKMCSDFGIKKDLKKKNVGDKKKIQATLEAIKKNPKIIERIKILYQEDFEFYEKLKKERNGEDAK